MTYAEINTAVKAIATSLNVPYTYHHFESDTYPPFLVFLYPGRADFYADNENYQHITELDIEFYSDNKDIAAETSIENLLPWPYRKTEVYIESEKMYETLYECEVLITYGE